MTKGRKPREKKAPLGTARDAALRLLATRDHSQRELSTKLKRRGFPAEEVAQALSRLGELGLQDDARFAARRAAGLATRGKHGPRAIAQKLAAAGVERGAAGRALSAAMEEVDELAQVKALVAKRYDAAELSGDAKVKGRAFRFLLGRGFSPGVVAKALGEAGLEAMPSEDET